MNIVSHYMGTSLALGYTVKTQDSSYWNSANGEQFRNFLGYSLERSADVHVKQVVRRGGTRESALRSFYGMTDENSRNFAIQTYGRTWTKEHLGF